jgi:signal transduction histidine kinase
VELEGGSIRASIPCCWPREISRVLNNLVENALRHTPAGGKVGWRERWRMTAASR